LPVSSPDFKGVHDDADLPLTAKWQNVLLDDTTLTASRCAESPCARNAIPRGMRAMRRRN